MSKKYIGVVAAVLMLMVSVYVLISKTQDSKNLGPAEKIKEIIYGVNGYIPKKAFIKAGDTITFKNWGKSSMWPISDPHPNHQAYPDFNPKKEFRTGESWNFTFAKPGVWKYHDEINPTHQAIITVR